MLPAVRWGKAWVVRVRDHDDRAGSIAVLRVGRGAGEGSGGGRMVWRGVATGIAGWMLGVYAALLLFGPTNLGPVMTIPPTMLVLAVVLFLARTVSTLVYVGALGAAVAVADMTVRVLGLL